MKEDYILPKLNKYQMVTLYNALKMFHGDFRDIYIGTDMHKEVVEEVMAMFPEEIRY